MAERLNAHDSKSCDAGMYPRVQIPLSAPNKHRNCDTIRYHKSGAYFYFKKSWFSRLFCFLWARLSFSVLLCSSIITLFFYQNPPLSYSLKPYRHLTSKRKVSALHHIKRTPKVVIDLGSFPFYNSPTTNLEISTFLSPGLESNNVTFPSGYL